MQLSSRTKRPLARTRLRGATMAEYALMLVGVLLVGAGAYKALGNFLNRQTGNVGSQVHNSEGSSGGGGGGATASGGGQAGGGGKAAGGGGGGAAGGGKAAAGGDGTVGGGSVGGKMNASSKAGVGGVGGAEAHAAGGGGGGGGGESGGGGGGGGATGAVVGADGNINVDEGFGFKRWFGIGMLAAGLGAIVYVVFGMRRAKKAADALGPKDAKGKKIPGVNLPPPPSIR
jgi:hypothetical protein